MYYATIILIMMLKGSKLLKTKWFSHWLNKTLKSALLLRMQIQLCH